MTVAESNGITLVHCMADARRYFIAALDDDPNRAEHALQQIQLLYEIEQLCIPEMLTSGPVSRPPAFVSIPEWQTV